MQNVETVRSQKKLSNTALSSAKNMSNDGIHELEEKIADLQILVTKAADFIVEALPASEAPKYISLLKTLRSASKPS